MIDPSGDFEDVVRSLAEHRRVPDSKRAPLRRQQDLMRDPRLNPDDWQKLRALAEWSEVERQQMDVDHENLGEDHAYFIWHGAWKEKWRNLGKGL